MKVRILQLNTSIPLKCGTGCLFIKLKLGRVGMGRVLHLGPSWHGPSFKWAELVLGRVVLHPNLGIPLSYALGTTQSKIDYYQLELRAGKIHSSARLGECLLLQDE